MTDVIESPKLIYPHEGLDILRENAQLAGSASYELAQFAHFLTLQVMHIESLSSRSRSFAVANGEAGADILPSKQRFSELVNELGYRAPRSVTVDPAKIKISDKHKVEVLDERSPQRFCKPANGARGRGARMLDTPEAALDYVSTQNEPFLVQSFEKPERDWRYVIHRDSTQIANNDRSGWRVLLKVERPVVTGAGGKSIAQLVADNDQMPETAKGKYLKRHKNEALVVPAEGEIVELLQTGNREQGAYMVPHSGVEERNLDRFMAQFVRDLEKRLVTTLGTVCVDMGVTDSRVLQGDFDFTQIRNHTVFYEHQLPFGIKPYLKSMPAEIRWGAIDRWIPASRRRVYTEDQVYLNFMRSVIRSGRLLGQLHS